MLMGIGPYRLQHQWINRPNIDLYGLVSALPSLGARQAVPHPQPFRQSLRRQQPRYWPLRVEPQRRVFRIEQRVGQILSPLGNGQRANIVAPILPEFIQSSRPHLGQHSERGGIDRGFLE